MGSEVTVVGVNVPALVAEMAEKAAGYAEAAKASNTRRAYRADWMLFEAWCAARGVEAMPTSSDTVLAFLIDHAGKLKVSTLQRRLSAIREAHLYRGIKLDTSSAAFRDVWRGIRRTHAVPTNKKAPLLTGGCAGQLRPFRIRWRVDGTGRCCSLGLVLLCDGRNWRGSRSGGCKGPWAGSRRRLMASQSIWALPKPTRPARGRRLASPTARTSKPAQSGHTRLGWPSQGFQQGQHFGRSTAAGAWAPAQFATRR
jgi:hypothetical protein